VTRSSCYPDTSLRILRKTNKIPNKESRYPDWDANQEPFFSFHVLVPHGQVLFRINLKIWKMLRHLGWGISPSQGCNLDVNNRHTPMPQVGLEPAVAVSERRYFWPQTRTANEIGELVTPRIRTQNVLRHYIRLPNCRTRVGRIGGGGGQDTVTHCIDSPREQTHIRPDGMYRLTAHSHCSTISIFIIIETLYRYARIVRTFSLFFIVTYSSSQEPNVKSP
jgi:hypothetical protein